MKMEYECVCGDCKNFPIEFESYTFISTWEETYTPRFCVTKEYVAT